MVIFLNASLFKHLIEIVSFHRSVCVMEMNPDITTNITLYDDKARSTEATENPCEAFPGKKRGYTSCRMLSRANCSASMEMYFGDCDAVWYHDS